jgi:4'-phosphopantetheinyl transferase
MKVYRIHIALVAKERHLIESLLPEERLKKAASYRLVEDQLRSLGAGYLLWRYTSDTPITYGIHGKPEKEGECFNLSHAGDYAVLVVDDVPVGIDLERYRTGLKAWKKKAFSPEEKREIHQETDFFLRWTRKESVGKANGIGLSKGPLALPSNDGINHFAGKTYMTHSLEEGDYFLSVSHEGNEDFEIKIEDVTDIVPYRFRCLDNKT